jgi:ubiquinone/menaquinone biosynthesis C-methylase UbiE
MTNYDRVTGYSPTECVDTEKMRRVIQIVRRIIGDYYSTRPGDTILVAGTGQGNEAALVNQEFGLPTTGIDVNLFHLAPDVRKPGVWFQRQDLLALAFRDNSFALEYSYHVLEHVSDPVAALRELYRILKPGGVLFIGFPNRHRVASYFGASQKASLLEKIKWNINDYSFRLKGKFENRYGAHAGFSEKEFIHDVSQMFHVVYSVRDQYMLLKYWKFRGLIRVLIGLGLAEIAFPSNYYVCQKQNL